MKHLKRLSDPFVIGVTITALYLGVIFYETMVISASANWVEEKKLNNLGDFLAGVFAPIAFLWLIVTVFLQKQELAETRKEIARQSDAMKAQVEEAKAHKEFIERQTNIMTRQAELAEITYAKDRKLQLFDRRIEVYEALKTFTEKPFSELVNDKETNDFVHLYNKVMFLFAEDSEIIPWMMRINDIITRVINEDDIAEVRSEWDAETNPDVFHLAFMRYLTIYE